MTTHVTLTTKPTARFTIPRDVVRRYRNRLHDVMMLPSAAIDALAVARSENASIHQFAALIERDPKLTADILRLANCSTFSGGQPVERVDRAIGRLGFRACEQIILATSVSTLSRHVPLQLQHVTSVLSRHAFTTAMLAKRLNRMLHLGFQGEEFAAAMLHDFGRTLIAIVDSDLFAKADKLEFAEDDVDVIQRERSIVGADHCSIGWWFAKSSGLPKSIRDTVRLHHTPELAAAEPRLVHLVAAADHVANHIQRTDAGPTQPYDAMLNSSLSFLMLSSHQTLNDRFRDQLALAVDESICDVDMMAGHAFSSA